jgi:site-specific DNA recombinase
LPAFQTARRQTGLPERMMTPEVAAEAMRAYTQKTNRLNRQRRSSSEFTRPELAEAAKAVAEIVRVVEQGGLSCCRFDGHQV